MATEAAEVAAVANGAGFAFEFVFEPVVAIDVAGGVGGGHELGGFSVALLAGEGGIDLGMAGEAVGHVGEVGRLFSDSRALLDALVAGGAGVFGIEVRSADGGFSLGSEPRAGGDGAAECGGEIAELGVDGMIELVDGALGRGLDGDLAGLMA